MAGEPLPPWFPVALDEQLLFATTPVFFEDSIIGTGFFYRPKSDEKLRSHFLVTAFHVLKEIYAAASARREALVSVEYHVSLDGSVQLGVYARCSFRLTEVRIHAKKDLAVVRLNPGDTIEKGVQPQPLTYHHLPTPARYKQRDLFYKTLSEVHLRTDRQALELLTASAQVIIPGYPDKHWDEKNRFPMLRTGTTAAHHALHFCGDPYEGRLNVSTSHNDSGAPIIARNDPAKMLQIFAAGLQAATRQPPQTNVVPDFSFLGVYIGAIKTKDSTNPLAYYLKGSLLLDIHNWKSPSQSEWLEQPSDSLVTEHSSPKIGAAIARASPASSLEEEEEKRLVMTHSSLSASPLGSSSPQQLLQPSWQRRLTAQFRRALAHAQDDANVKRDTESSYMFAQGFLKYLSLRQPQKRLQTPAIATAYGGLFEIGWWPSVTVFIRPKSVRCFDGKSTSRP